MRYRKKPVIVEAIEITETLVELFTFIRAFEPIPSVRAIPSDGGFWLEIPTLEGVMTAGQDDFLIRGVAGELYPCKPDIFHATYEVVDGETMNPTIGRIVIYKSKIDNGPGNDVLSPAIVLRTRATTVPAVIDRWGPEPTTVHSASDPSVTHETAARPTGVLAELPDDTTVDLLVHGLGKDYREYAVTQGDGFGQWQWPERVTG
jgi:hypothetical protein